MKKSLYVGKKSIFLNSDSMFVEYNDVLNCPWYTLLCFVKDNQSLNDMFDISEISSLSYEELMEWYIFRKYRNIYRNLPLKRPVSTEELDKFLYEQMGFSKLFFSTHINLTFNTILEFAMQQKSLIRKFYIYSEYNNPFLKEEITSTYPEAELITGNFKEIIHQIPQDSTFVFSDLNKVNIMAEEDKLNYTSIIVSNGFRYNYSPDNDKDYIINLEDLQKKFLFKFNFFNNFKILQE